MKSNEIESILMKKLPLKKAQVISHDNHHFQIIAIGEIFNQLSRVERQQIIYKPLMPYITDQCIHAITIRTYTPEEWQKAKKN